MYTLFILLIVDLEWVLRIFGPRREEWRKPHDELHV